MKVRVVVNDLMQADYVYYRTEIPGKNFSKIFKPQLTPCEMLELGVFGGKYMTDCGAEFPKAWFKIAKLSADIKNTKLNYFRVNASLPLSEWKRKGWLHPDDPRGWFQWYCRYYMGRRMPEEDLRQIERWRAFRRHAVAVEKFCRPGDMECRRRQRQALLQWAYDSRKI